MSLFNDMLRDLEARGAPSPLAVSVVASGTPRKKHRTRAAVIGLSSLLGSMVVVAVVWMRGESVVATHVAPTRAAAPQATLTAPTASATTVTSPALPFVAATSVATTPAATSEATAADATLATPTPPVVGATSVATPAPTLSAATAVATDVAPTKAAAPPRSDIRAHAEGETGVDLNRRLQAISTALSEGREREAEFELRVVLTQEPGHVRARQSLGSLLQRQGRIAEAEAAWSDGLRVNPHQADWAQALARSQLARGDASNATAVLSAAAPPLAGNSDYHALLAYAWQQAGQAQRAADSYQALLAFDASNAAWWLGLALAQESLGNPAAALSAFQRARAGAGLENSVLRYVDNRISALQARSP